ncbi:MAG: chorismate-binding protein, partial [Chloroflexi bacterium]|nr:chorismate-binding protein [Chloroflexota bacterium]
MYAPSLDEVKKLAHLGNLVPIHREISADLETPVTAYLKVARGPYSFLLESVEGGERIARYSFIGTEPLRVIRTGVTPDDTGSAKVSKQGSRRVMDYGHIDPLIPIEDALRTYQSVPVKGLPRFHGGAVGYLAYEAVRYFERLPAPAPDPNGLPEAIFMVNDTLLVFDHVQHKIKVVSHAYLNGDVEQPYAVACAKIDRVIERLSRPLKRPLDPGEPPRGNAKVESNITQAQHEAMVRDGKKYIVAGDIIQVVVSQRLSRATVAHPFDIYRALRKVNPSPYMFYLDLDGFQLVGASPEMLVQVEDGRVATNPIAGTRPRGTDETQDAALEAELKADIKERAEHVMLVDLGRNDVGRVSKPGTVKVEQFMDVERYSHVMHLVSRVTGQLREGMTCYDALRA